ncbi:hypothetical protein M8C21_031724 [Ambrosia artemisiifolia]|uniref:Protein SENSITIVE TO UV 2 n=1 Tax=Ambrosia artemisiifolia TaxID=4212 RepID=A0AAD5BL03_AMBAR|nr:hypothetical protein M8C21_031724 [Ambrosia artemisiifolia]
MGDDDDEDETWDKEFLDQAIILTDAAAASSSSYSNPTTTTTQQPPPLFRPSPPQPPVYTPPSISYSPPRELSQRPLNQHSSSSTTTITHTPFPPPPPPLPPHNNNNNPFNQPFNPPPPSSSLLLHQDNSSKQHEINRLKDELGRVSKVLANLEQECSELRKDREKNEKQLRLALPVNASEAFATNNSTLSLRGRKNKDPIEDPSVCLPRTKGVISCKAVGVQTDGHAISTDVTIKKNLSVSRKLASIWETQNGQIPRTNLFSKLFVACEADLQILFGFLGLNIPSKKTTPKMTANHSIQSAEAAKVSHLYITLTKMMIVHRSLCVLHVVLKHILNTENNLCCRDNVFINDPSTVNRSSGEHFEMGHMLSERNNETSNLHHPVLSRLISAKKIQNKDNSRNESQPLISGSKWFSLFQTMHQVVTRRCEENIRVEAVSIMNILLLRTDAFTEREMYGDVSVFQSISQLLRKEAGLGVQKQAVHLLHLLLNCPNLMLMFCSSFKEEGTSAEVTTTGAENGHPFQVLGSVLDGLADCLAFHGNGAPTNLVLKLQRNTIVVLAFLASSGRSGFEIFLGHNLSRRTNFLYLILQIMASEIDVETSECIQPSEGFRERTLLIREALILLNRLVSNSQYSTPVLQILTNRRDMAILTIDVASRLSRKSKWLWQSDAMTRQMRESEIVDLARMFKKRVFTFLGDAT